MEVEDWSGLPFSLSLSLSIRFLVGRSVCLWVAAVGLSALGLPLPISLSLLASAPLGIQSTEYARQTDRPTPIPLSAIGRT